MDQPHLDVTNHEPIERRWRCVDKQDLPQLESVGIRQDLLDVVVGDRLQVGLFVLHVRGSNYLLAVQPNQIGLDPDVTVFIEPHLMLLNELDSTLASERLKLSGTRDRTIAEGTPILVARTTTSPELILSTRCWSGKGSALSSKS